MWATALDGWAREVRVTDTYIDLFETQTYGKLACIEMRNRVLLYRRAHVPRTWVAQDVPRLLLKLAGMGLFVRPRLANLRAMLRGIAHGIAGRDGPMPG